DAGNARRRRIRGSRLRLDDRRPGQAHRSRRARSLVFEPRRPRNALGGACIVTNPPVAPRNDPSPHSATQTRHGAYAGETLAVPDGRCSNPDLEARLDTNDKWIVERTGIRERRIAGTGETSSTLGTAAAADAIKRAGLTPADIDLLVVATATPDQLLPHTGA